MKAASLFAIGVMSFAIFSWTPADSAADARATENTQPQALQIGVEPEAGTTRVPKINGGDSCSQELAYQFDMECALLEKTKSKSHMVTVLCCHRLEVSG